MQLLRWRVERNVGHVHLRSLVLLLLSSSFSAILLCFALILSFASSLCSAVGLVVVVVGLGVFVVVVVVVVALGGVVTVVVAVLCAVVVVLRFLLLLRRNFSVNFFGSTGLTSRSFQKGRRLRLFFHCRKKGNETEKREGNFEFWGGVNNEEENVFEKKRVCFWEPLLSLPSEALVGGGGAAFFSSFSFFPPFFLGLLLPLVVGFCPVAPLVGAGDFAPFFADSAVPVVAAAVTATFSFNCIQISIFSSFLLPH